MTTKLSTILNLQDSGDGIVLIKENRDPLASDTATLGAIWINETTNRFFICTDDTLANIVWESGSGGESIATDTRDPNSSDLGNMGQLWINTLTNKFFICTEDTPGATVWGTDTQIDVILDTVNPGSANSGHPLGTLWVNTDTKRLFFCVDNSSGAAVWRSTIEVIDSSVDPTIDDYQYPLGTLWINSSDINQKTYFVLLSNEVDKAVWSKNETDVYWVTDPTISGSVVAECDETLYTYNASGALSSIDESTSLTYNWSLTNGVLTNTTGTSVSLYFTNDQRDSEQILSCYVEDDLGYISKTIHFPIQVRVVNPVSGLNLSLPNKIYTNELSFFDVTVGYTGGDDTLNYFWETSENGVDWVSVFMVNPNVKLSEAILTSTGDTYVRCTVTNLGGSVVITSGPIPTIDIVTDSDSTYLDTDRHMLENKEYDGEFVSSSVLGVRTLMFDVDDRVIVEGEQDNISAVSELYDTTMNMITDEVLLNDNYTSYTTVCTLMGNKIIVAYVDNNISGKGVVRVGTFNGDVVSFGEPVTFNNDYSQYIKILPMVDNKIVIVYRNDGNNNLGGSKVGTVTGDTISFGAEFIFNSVDTDYIDVCKITDDRFAVAYSDYGTGNLGTLVVGQISGSSITYGSQQVYTNSAFFNSVSLIDSEKLCIAYQDDINSKYGTAIIAGVSGTSLTLGSPQIFNSNGITSYINVNTVDTNKVAISYQDVGTSGHGFTVIGTVSATNIIFGIPVAFETSDTTYISSNYSNDRLFVAYRNGSNDGIFNFGEISGTSISFSNSKMFNEHNTDFIQTYDLDNKMVVVYKDGGDADKGKMMVFTPFYQEITLENETVSTDTVITRLNTEYILPIIGQEPAQDVFEKVEISFQTDRNNLFDTYEDTGKAVVEHYEIAPYVVGDRVLLQGDTNEHNVITQIDRTVLPGTGDPVKGDKFVFDDLNTQQTSSVLIDDRYMICAYRDNSSAGSIVYGEVKYDEIFFYDDLTFSSSDVDYVSAVKVSDNKVVVAYRDKSDSSGKAFVAKVTDGVLSIGGMFQFNGGSTEHIDIDRLDDNSFVISYQDSGDSGKGKCIMGSTSDTNLSFGSAIEFNANNTTYTSVRLISANKIAVGYRDVNNSGAGTIRVGDIVGSNINFGTTQIFSSTSTTYIGIDILSANKMIIKYTDYANSNFGTVIVGDVSGTNVTYGASQNFNQNETYYSSVVVPFNNVFMIVYDDYTGTRAFSRIGTVTGNTITLDTPVEINNSTTSHIDAFVIDSRKVVATFSDQGNSYKGTAQIIRRDIDLIKSEIQVDGTIPSSLSTIELLSYRVDASTGYVQSFDSTEYYHTDLDEIYSVLNGDTLLTTATITTSGNYFYSRIRSANNDEYHKYITRIGVDFWTQP